MSLVKAVDLSSFEEEVLDAPVPVLVDFYATWCGPCRALAPTLEALAAEYAGRAKVCKVNVDTEEKLSRVLTIAAVPALLFFAGGRLADRAAGALSADALRERLDAVLRGSFSTAH